MTDPAPYPLPARVLLGLAVGDAVGAAAEFKDAPAAARAVPDLARYRPGSPFGFLPGEATDDTQMTLAGLVAGAPFAPALPSVLAYAHAVWDAFATWADSNPPDIGSQTNHGALYFGAAWDGFCESAAAHKNPPAGNGGLMRAAAPFLTGFRGEALLRATVAHTAVTHADPRCVTDAVAFALLLERAERGEGLRGALAAVAEQIALADTVQAVAAAVRDVFRPGIEWRRVYLARLRGSSALTASALRRALGGELTAPTGFTTATLINACVHAQQPYPEAILAAAQNGGDADTIGCVTGALAAAFDPAPFAFPEAAGLLAGLRVGHAWELWPDRAVAAAKPLANLTRNAE